MRTPPDLTLTRTLTLPPNSTPTPDPSPKPYPLPKVRAPPLRHLTRTLILTLTLILAEGADPTLRHLTYGFKVAYDVARSKAVRNAFRRHASVRVRARVRVREQMW